MRKKILGIVLLLAALAALSAYLRSSDPAALSQTKEPARTLVPLQDIFYDPSSFDAAIRQSRLKNNAGSKPGVIVVPHHLVASEIIGELFSAAASREIDTVVIIGPNHDDKNASTIAAAHLEWETPLGKVRTNSRLVSALLRDLGLRPAPDAFGNEHSVGAMVPFARYFFPDVEIVPIIYNSTATLEDAASTAKWLDKNLGDNSLVVVSTDFSHYLSEEEAGRKDRETEQFILKGEVEKIIKLGNDHVDSPASLVTALLYAELKNLSPRILRRANFNDFSEIPSAQTTSYFGIAF